MKKCPQCNHCHSKERLIKYASRISKKGIKTQYYRCNKCNTETCKKYRKTKIGRENVLKAVKKYESKNVDRVKSWHKAWFKINKNKKNDKPCSICGSKLNVHKHHPDINKPLEVVFLCAYHHKQVDKNDV